MLDNARVDIKKIVRGKVFTLLIIFLIILAHLGYLLLFGPSRAGVMLAMGWPSDSPFKILFYVISSLGFVALSLLIIKHTSTAKTLWYSMGGIGFLYCMSPYIPLNIDGLEGEHIYYFFGGVLSLLAFIAILMRDRNDPLFPIILFLLLMLPILYLIRNLYLFYQYYTYLLCALIVAWLIYKELKLKRKGIIFIFTFASFVGLFFGHLKVMKLKGSWYGNYISFNTLQFGNIDNDGYPDLLTCGYWGMVAGNPTWFKGVGNGFKDWNDSHALPCGQTYVIMQDFDNDGDLDIINGYGGLLINDGKGNFILKDDAIIWEEPEEMFSISFNEDKRPVFEKKACYLNNDEYLDVFMKGDGEKDVYILSQGGLKWKAFLKGDALLKINSDGKGTIMAKKFSYELKSFLENNSISYASLPDSLPIETDKIDSSNGERIAYFWEDVNMNGKQELVIWENIQSDKPVQSIKHFGGGGRFVPFYSKIRIYREGSDKYTLLSSFKTSLFINPISIGPSVENKFVDFDKDGNIDFLGDDGKIYFMNKKYIFEKSTEINLDNGDNRGLLYSYDINSDGWQDIISSYQPFWNYKLGPFRQE